LRVVFAHAIANQYRINQLNPAQWKDRLEHRLELKWMKKKSDKHFPALQYEDAYPFGQLAKQRGTMADRALRVQMACELRPHNVLEVLQGEMLNRRPGPFGVEIWTIAASKMKKRRTHEVYIDPWTLKIIDEEMKTEPVVLKGFDPRFTRVWARGTRREKPPLTQEEYEAIRNAPSEMFTSILAMRYDRTERHINMIRSGAYEPKHEQRRRIASQTTRPTPQATDRFFGGRGKDGNLGDTAVWKAMRAILNSMAQPFLSVDGKLPVPHGSRATFETFALECTVFREAVISAGMAHRHFGGKDREERNQGRMLGIYFYGSFEEDRAALQMIWGEYFHTGSISPQWKERLTTKGRTFMREEAEEQQPSATIVELPQRRERQARR
jgi:integrase